MLKGAIYITDSLDIVYNIPSNSNIKIVSLDEDDILDRKANPGIILGTCLLPPMDAMIAEADGNEQLYDTVYSAHLLDIYQQQFIAALLAYLYKGGNLIMFLPELGQNTRNKLIFHLYSAYGICPGIIEPDPNRNVPYIIKSNWGIDLKCVPIWMNMIYSVHAISAYEFLAMYPIDAQINNKFVISELIKELKPYADTYNEKVNNIINLHKLIHKAAAEGKKVISPIMGVEEYVDVWN